MRTTREIGTQLVQAALERVERVESEKMIPDNDVDGMKSSHSLSSSIHGKDLLSVLGEFLVTLLKADVSLWSIVRSNVADFESKNLSHEEILCQISTFMWVKSVDQYQHGGPDAPPQHLWPRDYYAGAGIYSLGVVASPSYSRPAACRSSGFSGGAYLR